MEKSIKSTAFISLVITVVLSILYMTTSLDVLLSLAITFGTVAYHFIMRLLVSLIFDTTMRNHADYTRRWYQVGKRELSLYKKIKVKQWKNKMPTYDASLFDPRIHTWDEIAQAMCQAELVHETIVVISFLPIIAGNWFGAYPVFIITSVVSAAIDLSFVFIQRYNRQRVIRLLKCSAKNCR